MRLSPAVIIAYYAATPSADTDISEAAAPMILGCNPFVQTVATTSETKVRCCLVRELGVDCIMVQSPEVVPARLTYHLVGH